MKKVKNALAAVLILILLTGSFPAMQVYADGTSDEVFYVGYGLDYTCLNIGKISKVTSSNTKIATVTKLSNEMIFVRAKAPGKSTITIKGSNYAYKLNLTVKKMDVTAKFVKKLPDGSYLVKVTNKTKEGFFEGLNLAVVLRSADGEFLDYETYNVGIALPGKSFYTTYKPWDDIDFNLSKSTLEVSDFDYETKGSHIIFTDCSSKIALTGAKAGVITPYEDKKITLKVKNNSSNAARIIMQTFWYDENGKIVDVHDNIFENLEVKKADTKDLYIPDKDIGAVSYSISIRAYNKVYPTPTNVVEDIPTVK